MKLPGPAGTAAQGRRALRSAAIGSASSNSITSSVPAMPTARADGKLIRGLG